MEVILCFRSNNISSIDILFAWIMFKTTSGWENYDIESEIYIFNLSILYTAVSAIIRAPVCITD